MPTSIETLISELLPERTILLFGSGSSLPSGAPSVKTLIEKLSSRFKVEDHGYSLSEIGSIIEQKTGSRKALIEEIRSQFIGLTPTGGILNLPHFNWRSLYTTNYDHLIEDAYAKAGAKINSYTTDFDFSQSETAGVQKLFKLHGTIEKDISDGYVGRMILTEADYDLTDDYRRSLYDRLKGDLAGGHLIVIGHSLADPHIKDITNRAAQINLQAGGVGRISLLLYTEDLSRAGLFESRNIQVTFGGIDEFFAAMARSNSAKPMIDRVVGDRLAKAAGLRPLTVDVRHQLDSQAPDPKAMFSGSPASYSDVASGLTFDRLVRNAVSTDILERGASYAVLLGTSGLGKTTAARQIVHELLSHGYEAWEHKRDTTFEASWWLKVAESLKADGQSGVLFVDDAHEHLHELNKLIDDITFREIESLSILLTSSKHQWGPRVKSPAIYRFGKEYPIGKLHSAEIDRLLNLVENEPRLSVLISDGFSGFNRHERRRRLVQRCESETFVCLKNIFASESFDNIILAEFSALEEPLQDIYRIVAAMENAGVHVHRQLVVRLLGISANKISAVLDNLEEIISEYPINERENVYGWRGRHPVIVGIIAKYKYNDMEKIVRMFDQVIDATSPAYDIECRSLREMCNLETGISRIPDKAVQNRLLRKMMSIAPGERVPRHRLIKNLLDEGDFAKVETEIRIFGKDFKRDGPITRYKINLIVARATRSSGLMLEDRLTILEDARSVAAAATESFKNHKGIMRAYCEVGIEIYRLSGSLVCFDEAMTKLKMAEARLGDPDISRIIRSLERQITAQSWEEVEESSSVDVD